MYKCIIFQQFKRNKREIAVLDHVGEFNELRIILVSYPFCSFVLFSSFNFDIIYSSLVYTTIYLKLGKLSEDQQTYPPSFILKVTCDTMWTNVHDELLVVFLFKYLDRRVCARPISN